MFVNIFYYICTIKSTVMNTLQIEEIIKVFHRKLTATPTEFHRYLYDKIDWRDSLIGIKGPKGCGKTTLMLQHIKESFTGDALKSVLYVSLDNLWFASNSLTDLIEFFYNNGGKYLFIDEIHYEPRWQRLLKNLSDNYPALNIAYTGSSMLKIEAGEGDLSRRQTLYEMRGMSFREYLHYENILTLEPVSLEDLLTRHIDIAMKVCAKVRILQHFNEYLKIGYYPFYKTVYSNLYARIEAVVNQVIENDYPSIDDVTPSTIRKTKKLLMVLTERVPQTPNMKELFTELETDRNQGLKMLYALQRGGLLLLLGDNAQSPDNLSKPDKIYINNTTLMYALSPHADLETLRETFFFNQLSQAHDVRYPKHGDFLIDKRYVFEVGGKGKKFSQIKDIPDSYLAVDDFETGIEAKIPLWMFGLLY